MSRLVIVAPNWLGDAVMALPAIADLRRALPEVTIAVAAKPAVASLFGMVRDVDEIIEKATGVLPPTSGCCCRIRSARRWTSSGPAF
jgi:ADP-heptose:LPS heptosyltransferase